MPYVHHPMMTKPTATLRKPSLRKPAQRLVVRTPKAASLSKGTTKKNVNRGGIDVAELFAHTPRWMQPDRQVEFINFPSGGRMSIGNIPLYDHWSAEDEPILVSQIDFPYVRSTGPLAGMAGATIIQTENQLALQLIAYRGPDMEIDDDDDLGDRENDPHFLESPSDWKTNPVLAAIAADAGTAFPACQSALWGWTLVGMRRLMMAADATCEFTPDDLAQLWTAWLRKHFGWTEQVGTLWALADLRTLLLSPEKSLRTLGVLVMASVGRAQSTATKPSPAPQAKRGTPAQGTGGGVSTANPMRRKVRARMTAAKSVR